MPFVFVCCCFCFFFVEEGFVLFCFCYRTLMPFVLYTSKSPIKLMFAVELKMASHLHCLRNAKIGENKLKVIPLEIIIFVKSQILQE